MTESNISSDQQKIDIRKVEILAERFIQNQNAEINDQIELANQLISSYMEFSNSETKKLFTNETIEAFDDANTVQIIHSYRQSKIN